MCDCLHSAPPAFSLTRFHEPVFVRSYCLQRLSNSKSQFHRQLVRRSSRVVATRASSNGDDLGFKDETKEHLDFKPKQLDASLSRIERDSKNANGEGDDTQNLLDRVREGNGRSVSSRGRQVIKRSSLIAKQVISVQSAISLGFVSQLWVDTTSWAVLVVEVRRNLLSGEAERLLLEDVSQVGDVVLVEDESVMENETKMVDLETLVGYRVETPRRRNIGKVRGYSFNINSGAIESLELDSFGISIIPSSLVSTYALLVEDILEVLSDTVVVHEAAASHIQRLTKGLLDTQNVGTSMDDFDEDSELRRPITSDRGRRSTHRSVRRQKFDSKIREMEDDLELPMDYL
ncbi:hypothetical protein HS088_TW05G00410 [Tripterygium wilfordii]|uniref:Uncharacterized protein n=1 Tax=Tripterygium wilfordii TaxID=458696 RepID=A0A7J7DN19_TRIWF|nr:uncharacterized protein LOC119998275 [Tripterygium wilfordii]KAF5747683.1 hypothetical protein HS088_TW05G00410 [Tripterygium wilfordii]